MKVAAVVLAAGASTRMGRPKALIEWRGRPFVVHCIALARGAGCAEVVVVEGAVALPELEATKVLNLDWKHGPLSSLQTGIAALQADPPQAVLVLSVDRPHVKISTVQALFEAHRQHPGVFVQPTFAGRRGHPVLYPWELARELCSLEPWDTPRTLLSRPEIATQKYRVEVEDPAVLQNIDTPQDVTLLQPRPESAERE